MQCSQATILDGIFKILFSNSSNLAVHIDFERMDKAK